MTGPDCPGCGKAPEVPPDPACPECGSGPEVTISRRYLDTVERSVVRLSQRLEEVRGAHARLLDALVDGGLHRRRFEWLARLDTGLQPDTMGGGRWAEGHWAGRWQAYITTGTRRVLDATGDSPAEAVDRAMEKERQLTVFCPECHGSGLEPLPAECWRGYTQGGGPPRTPCPRCGGTGRLGAETRAAEPRP